MKTQTKTFWTTVQKEFEANKNNFLCNASETFYNIWNGDNSDEIASVESDMHNWLVHPTYRASTKYATDCLIIGQPANMQQRCHILSDFISHQIEKYENNI